MIIKIILIFTLLVSFNLFAKTGSVTGLEIPRYVSLKSDEVNLRIGPSVNYPIKIIKIYFFNEAVIFISIYIKAFVVIN